MDLIKRMRRLSHQARKCGASDRCALQSIVPSTYKIGITAVSVALAEIQAYIYKANRRQYVKIIF